LIGLDQGATAADGNIDFPLFGKLMLQDLVQDQ
jgi:hypothetical protein